MDITAIHVISHVYNNSNPTYDPVIYMSFPPIPSVKPLMGDGYSYHKKDKLQFPPFYLYVIGYIKKREVFGSSLIHSFVYTSSKDLDMAPTWLSDLRNEYRSGGK